MAKVASEVVQISGQLVMLFSSSDRLLLPPLATRIVMIIMVIIEASNMAAFEAAARGKHEYTQETLLNGGKHRYRTS